MKLIYSAALICLTGITHAGVIPPFDLERIATGFSQPLALRHAGDGSGRVFVVEQDGRVYVVDATHRVLETPFLDLSGETGLNLTNSSGEQGLLGLAFHPQFASNGFFYVNYSDRTGGDTVIARYTVDSGNPNMADPTSGVILIEIDQDAGNHNGGDLHFGPDGYLYIGMGDGGGAGDPRDRAQQPDSLLGKMLRLDVDNQGTNATFACGPAANYGIPDDNPFDGDDGICAETWAFGLRNPYRFSFDANTGDMFIGDVGQDRVEEIDFQPAASAGGENYGWDCREGSTEYGISGDRDAPSPLCDTVGPLVDPILEVTHTEDGCSITGGYRYRGGLAAASGLYFFGDFCTGQVYAGEELGVDNWSNNPVPGPYRDENGNSVSFGGSLTGFGEDEQKNLYIINRGGTVYRFGELVSADGFE
ncbi:MAG: PQQ-dependent sugar dehydrogenase [Xanthomonadales bacterium]|nr:PQQ-dependent sugar dehydrogenase [Xanthomonadales bacterium]